jgi:hypothetical protein
MYEQVHVLPVLPSEVLPDPESGPDDVATAKPDAEAVDNLTPEIPARIGRERHNEPEMNGDKRRERQTQILRSMRGLAEHSDILRPKRVGEFAPVHRTFPSWRGLSLDSLKKGELALLGDVRPKRAQRSKLLRLAAPALGVMTI